MSKTLKFALSLMLVVLLALPMMTAQAAGTTRYVNPDGVCDGNSPCYTTIQAAITAADPGNTISIATGTYSEPQLSINKNLTIQGAGVDDVIIQRSSGSSYFFNVSGIVSLTIQDLTIDAAGSATTNFVAHISGVTSVVVENVRLVGQGKDYTTDGGAYYYNNPSDTNIVGGLDLINVDSASLKNVVVEDNGRNCFGFSNVDSISLEDISATNCGHSDSTGWAGIAIYRADGGTSTLSLAGDNSVDNAQIGLNVGLVSGSANLPATGNLEITNSNVALVLPKNDNSDTFAEMVAGAPFKVYSTTGTSAFYFDNQADAIASALALKAFFGAEHFVYDLNADEFIIAAGMSIQEAINAASPNDTVVVGPGTYTENVTIQKSIDLRGANYNVNLNTETRMPESILDGTWSLRSSGISINGFQVTGAGAAFAAGGAGPWSDVTISHNIATGNTGQQTIAYGFSLGSVTTSLGAENWVISNNLIQEIQATDATAFALFNIKGLTISDNVILHTNDAYNGRRGLNIDGCEDVIISNNTIDLGLRDPASDNSDNSFTKARYPVQISASRGVTSNISVTDNTMGGAYDGIITLGNGTYTGITIENNTLHDVVLGIRFQAGTNVPAGSQQNILIQKNQISSSNRSIYLQDGSVGGGTPDPYTNVVITNNSLLRSTTGIVLEVQATATVTDSPVTATCNWWGSTDETEVEARVSGDVTYVPFLMSDDLDNPVCTGGLPYITVKSIAPQDGWIREKSFGSRRGGKVNRGAQTLRVGDSMKNLQFRSILSFDTSGIPDDAVITSITLEFKYAGKKGKLPFGSHGNLLVDMRQGAFRNNERLQMADFSAKASKSRVLVFRAGDLDDEMWYRQSMNPDYFQFLNRDGLTQFRLRFAKAHNNNFKADFLSIFSGNALDEENRPQLIVQYYVP